MVGRRGNKSNKVPGVKLRPALREARCQSNTQAFHPLLENETDDNTQFVDLCSRPFKGFVICATGVPEKTALFKKALELGALSTPDFTDRVTHLIAAAPQGAKYRCAVERKIPIMTPEWILESYEVWLRGDDVDVQESLGIHRMPIFNNIILTLSGVDDPKHRGQIQGFVRKEGGAYVKDLTRLTKVTHLLCAGDDITDKMRYAEKFNEKEGANIKVVWEEWFWDCLEFGGQFDEELYKVTHPRPEKRRFSPERPSSPPPSSDPTSTPDPVPLNKHVSKAPLQSNSLGDEDEEEIAQVKRVHSDTLRIWHSLLKPRGFEMVDGKLLRSSSKSQSCSSNSDDRVQSPPRVERSTSDSNGNPARSALSSFRRADSFAQGASSNRMNTGNGLFMRVPSAAPRAAPSFLQGHPTPLQRVTPIQNEEPNAINRTLLSAKPCRMFSGMKFRLLGEARAPNVRNAIEDYGGQVASSGEEDVDFVVVRLISGSKLYKDEADEAERSKYRTECWMERCIYEERVCSPHERVVFTPLKIDVPVPGAEDINLSFSGLDESEACWVRRVVRALGITPAPNFSRRSTHLLCPSATGVKYEKANEWSIPVVDLRWLEDIARLGIIPDVADYTVSAPNEAAAQPQPDSIAENSRNVVVKDVKGKGKETDPEHDVRMVDITNDFSLDNQPYDRRDRAQPVNVAHREDTLMYLDSVQPAPPPAFGNEGDVFGEPALLRARPVPLAKRGAISAPQLLGAEPIPGSSSDHNHDHDDRAQTVPSSNTPSPLKHPHSSSMPISPARPSPMAEATRALQAKLTTLLGKRPSEEEEAIAAKHGKRHRPPSRCKRQSRPNSRQNSGELPFPRAASPSIPFEHPFTMFLPRSFDDAEIHPAEGNVARLSDDSVRVTYEDPAQRAEQRRLMTLLGADDPKDAADVNTDDTPECGKSRRKNPARRSTRVAGF
ncbi:hypothetical protein NEOLEDRAFT_1084778 [Neolentinus lepideus HHB14362 ss-1]|uniref:BRCT domain-containing protein n=1 Tax=Neolentinus lepideus HHB14362 ss-1 TaxID=1314782 RepID=A0A165VML5_9AGAM|nr:hypothetical protein NEOLEDRAFT_1084778 [Neolentinus lepideus HHB14362 ss-1]